RLAVPSPQVPDRAAYHWVHPRGGDRVPWLLPMHPHRSLGLALLLVVGGCAAAAPTTPRPVAASEPASHAAPRPAEASPAPAPAAEAATEAEAEEPPPLEVYGDSLALLNDSRQRGTLAAARIEDGVRSGHTAIGACVAAAAQLGAVEGRVVVSFLIEPSGRVERAAIL